MKKMNLKKAATRLGEYIARNSVGKSLPFMFYEPKVPASLREQTGKDCR